VVVLQPALVATDPLLELLERVREGRVGVAAKAAGEEQDWKQF
jgi:hypothetical protein